MRVALIDYGAGNLHSAAKALQWAGGEAGLDVRVSVTGDAGDVAAADRIVLPGDGAFADCMGQLTANTALLDAISRRVRSGGVPFLGICVGMQLLADRGLEHGTTQGLGWVPGEVRRLTPAHPALKVPHMGWNTLDRWRPHPLLDGVSLGADGLHAYFLHSYQFAPADAADVVAEAEYGGPVASIIARDNVAGVQFHPEKSQRLGLRLLVNFLTWRP